MAIPDPLIDFASAFENSAPTDREPHPAAAIQDFLAGA